MSIDLYDKILQNYLLKRVAFKCGNKTLKTGKIKLFNIKQYFIRITLETDKGEMKMLELPYPFRIVDKNNCCTLNYHVSSFTKCNKALTKAVNNVNTADSMKIYDKEIHIIPL